MAGGRPKGSTNHQSKMIKEMLFEALDKAGGAEYLYQQSQANPTAFMTMLGKVMPTQVVGDDDYAPIQAALTVVFKGGNPTS
jgi:hypothetical protein